MDVREKLVELVHTIYNDQRMEFCDLYEMNANADTIADIMIENGVTVQEWIPASEPPKDDLPVLVTCGRGYRPFVARYDRIWKRWKVSHTLRITHWHPLPGTSNLPQPPKGE